MRILAREVALCAFHTIVTRYGVAAWVSRPAKILDAVSVHGKGGVCLAILQGQGLQGLSVILPWLVGGQQLGVELVVEADAAEDPGASLSILFDKVERLGVLGQRVEGEDDGVLAGILLVLLAELEGFVGQYLSSLAGQDAGLAAGECLSIGLEACAGHAPVSPVGATDVEVYNCCLLALLYFHGQEVGTCHRFECGAVDDLVRRLCAGSQAEDCEQRQ